MSNPDTWEKRLQFWNPRQPSEKVAQELFKPGGPSRSARAIAPATRHRIEILSWLTPVAACCFTMVVLCGSATRHAISASVRDNNTFFAMASSNVALKTFELSKADENLEWNVWPHASLPTTNYSYARSGLRQVSNSMNGIYP
jgi:hypothetical protein